VTRRLDRVARDAERTLAAARSAEAPDQLTDARSLLLTTLWLRARATKFMKDALESALGKSPPQAAMAKMADVGADLTAADRTYQGFVNAINDNKDFGREAALPASRWIEDDNAWAPEVLGAFITALRSAAELAPIHDVRIVLVTTEPGAVRKEGERLVLPLSKTIRTHIVVANVGNETERGLKVEVILTPGGERASLRDFVTLTPGQRQTVTLGGLVPLADQNADLTVTIDRPAGDTNDDNVKVIPIVAKQ
jgi:hypothetical protein